MISRLAPIVLVAACSACTTYEYEEEFFLDVDGSGRLRVSGSAAIVAALHRDGEAVGTPAGFRRYFDAEGLALDSVRETERGGRRFLHVEGSFDDWNELCRHPAFRGRDCGMDVTQESVRLELRVPAPSGPPPSDLDPEATVAFRFHLPSTVEHHNAPSPIARGNILEWESPVDEYFGGGPVTIETRFGRESVLATTARVLALALGIVVVLVASAIGLMVRKGRQQLAHEGAAVPSRSR